MPKDETGKIPEQIARLSSTVRDSVGIQSVDLLTELEIEKLRGLSDHADNLTEYAEAEMKSDSSASGVYRQLGDLGLIQTLSAYDGSVIVIGISPKSEWAIARFDRRAEAERLDKADARREKIIGYLIQALYILFGWLLGRLS